MAAIFFLIAIDEFDPDMPDVNAALYRLPAEGTVPPSTLIVG